MKVVTVLKGASLYYRDKRVCFLQYGRWCCQSGRAGRGNCGECCENDQNTPRPRRERDRATIALARNLARLLAYAQGSPRYSAEEREERDGTAAPARGADWPLAGKLQESHDDLHPASRHVWVGAMVEGRPNPGVQLLVNLEARTTTGYFWTTNLGALSMESGLRPAAAQLKNRQRLGLRLLNYRRGQAREMVGAPTAIGRRLTNALAYSGRMESRVLLEEQQTLDAELLQEEEAEAKAEAEKTRPRLTMFTDGSRIED